MFSDALTLRAFVLEVSQQIPLPWFVQKFSQVGECDFLLSLRCQRRTLRWLISLWPHRADWRLWSGPKPTALPASSLTMLVRKHLQGRTIESLESGYPERSLGLLGHQHSLRLELLDRAPNLVLTHNDGTVLGAFRLGKSSLRPLRLRRPYLPPPRPDGLLEAHTLTPYQLEELYLGGEFPQNLLRQTFGLSPGACAHLSPNFEERQTSWQAFWQRSLQDYRAIRTDTGLLSIWGVGEPRSLWQLLQEEGPPEQGPVLTGQEKQQTLVQASRAKERRRLQLRLTKLETDLVKAQQAEELQRQAELLLTYQAQVSPGAQEINLPDWDGTRRTLTLEPGLSPALQAKKWLNRAAKLRRSRKIIQERIQLTHQELAQIELPYTEPLPQAKTQAGKAPSAGLRRYRWGNFQLLLGRSPKQNDQLLRHFSARDDLWFHVKDAPGAHVVLKTAGQLPDQEAIEAAAYLAARFSSRARDGKVLVSFTLTQKVKKPVGAEPGLVVYSDELTLWVNLAEMPAGLQEQIQ